MSAVKLGTAIREAREARGITLRALAKMVGCSSPFLSDVEHGRRWPADVGAFERALGVTGLESMRAEDKLVEWPRLSALVREIVREELAKQPKHSCPNCLVLR